jgi:hypothetical protein
MNLSARVPKLILLLQFEDGLFPFTHFKRALKWTLRAHLRAF